MSIFSRKPKADVKQLASGVSSLVPLPQIYLRIGQMMDNPRTSMAQVGEVLGHDPALTARLLRFVNSPLYGLRNRVESVPRAITVLGFHEVRLLALASSVGGGFRKPPADLLDMNAYWSHSVFTAIAARKLGVLCQLREPERLFVAGLLHDVGQLVLCHKMPGEMRELNRALREQGGGDRIRLEREIIGCDHAEVGAELMRQWQLPESLWVPLLHHHRMADAPNYHQECAVIHLANAIADGVEPIHRPGEDLPQTGPITPEAWLWSALNDSVIDPVTQEARQQLAELLDIIASTRS
ncbi:MAG TPA: HDOD domain-containing protein [Methylococcaceae bacterium]|nr:HDOD domain-containing protein [Methylococcaceae bacterium]